MRAPLGMQAWALEICERHALKIAKDEKIFGKEAEHFREIIRAIARTNAAFTEHADDIRELIKSKRGRE